MKLTADTNLVTSEEGENIKEKEINEDGEGKSVNSGESDEEGDKEISDEEKGKHGKAIKKHTPVRRSLFSNFIPPRASTPPIISGLTVVPTLSFENLPTDAKPKITYKELIKKFRKCNENGKTNKKYQKLGLAEYDFSSLSDEEWVKLLIELEGMEYIIFVQFNPTVNSSLIQNYLADLEKRRTEQLMSCEFIYASASSKQHLQSLQIKNKAYIRTNDDRVFYRDEKEITQLDKITQENIKIFDKIISINASTPRDCPQALLPRQRALIVLFSGYTPMNWERFNAELNGELVLSKTTKEKNEIISEGEESHSDNLAATIRSRSPLLETRVDEAQLRENNSEEEIAKKTKLKEIESNEDSESEEDASEQTQSEQSEDEESDAATSKPEPNEGGNPNYQAALNAIQRDELSTLKEIFQKLNEDERVNLCFVQTYRGNLLEIAIKTDDLQRDQDHTAIVRFLLETILPNSTSIRSLDEIKITCLIALFLIAIAHGNVNLVNEFLVFDFHTIRNETFKPVINAVNAGRLPIVEVLLSHGFDPREKDAGNTPLELAIKLKVNAIPIIKLLVEKHDVKVDSSIIEFVKREALSECKYWILQYFARLPDQYWSVAKPTITLTDKIEAAWRDYNSQSDLWQRANEQERTKINEYINQNSSRYDDDQTDVSSSESESEENEETTDNEKTQVGITNHAQQEQLLIEALRRTTAALQKLPKITSQLFQKPNPDSGQESLPGEPDKDAENTEDNTPS